MPKPLPYHSQENEFEDPTWGSQVVTTTVEREAGMNATGLFFEIHTNDKDEPGRERGYAFYLKNEDAVAWATTILYVAKMVRDDADKRIEENE